MPPSRCEQLFERYRREGDLEALAQAFDELAPELLALAAHLARRKHDAEDLVQETLLAALEKAARYDAARPLRPWLVGILVHEARRWRRRNAREIESERLASPSTPTPEESAIAGELRAAVEAALSELPPKYAQVVALHLFEGLAPREIAPRLSIDATLVRTHLARGLERLRRSLPPSLGASWSAGELGALLAGMRPAWLARARALRPLASAAPAGAGMLAIAALLVASLASIAGLTASLLTLPSATEPGLANAEGPAPSPRSSARAVDARETERLAADANGRAPRRSLGSDPATRTANALARVHGMLLLPDGTPAGGVEVELHGSSIGSERAGGAELPQDWRDPPTARTDPDGGFVFALDPPRGLQWHASARRAGCVELRYRWLAWEAGEDLDLGTERFERAASLRGRLVRADGRSLDGRWHVAATMRAPRNAPFAESAVYGAEVNATDGSFRLDGLPAGSAELVALAPDGALASTTALELVPDEPAVVELCVREPETARRIHVQLQSAWPQLVPPASVRAVLVASDGRRLAPTSAIAPGRECLDFEELAEDGYRLEIEHPALEPVAREGLRPGAELRIRLAGSAGLRLHVLDADGRPLEHFCCEIEFLAEHARQRAQLASDAERSPAGRRFDELPAGIPFTLEIRTADGQCTEREERALAGGETRSLELRLARLRPLAVLALGEDGSAPLEGIEIELAPGHRAGQPFGPSGPLRAELGKTAAGEHLARTDATGRALLPALEPGRWTARAHWNGWFQSDLEFERGAGTPDELRLVQPPHGWIRGRILVAAGERADAQSLEVRPARWTGRDRARDLRPPAGSIADDGRFRWGPFAPGTVRVLLGRPASNPTRRFEFFTPLAELSIEAGRESELTLDLTRQTSATLALALRAEGRPLARPFVQAFAFEGGRAGAAESACGEVDGRVTLVLAPLARRLVVLRGAGWLWELPEEFEAAPGQALERSFEVPLRTRTLLLVDRATRAPLPAATIAWTMDWRAGGMQRTPQADPQLRADGAGTSDAQGRIALTLPPGEIDLRLQLPGDASLDELPPGCTTRLVWADAGPDTLEVALPARE